MGSLAGFHQQYTLKIVYEVCHHAVHKGIKGIFKLSVCSTVLGQRVAIYSLCFVSGRFVPVNCGNCDFFSCSFM